MLKLHFNGVLILKVLVFLNKPTLLCLCERAYQGRTKRGRGDGGEGRGEGGRTVAPPGKLNKVFMP